MCSSSDLRACITQELNISRENVTICHALLLNYSLDGHACGGGGFICSFPEVRQQQRDGDVNAVVNVLRAAETQLWAPGSSDAKDVRLSSAFSSPFSTSPSAFC